MAEDISKLCDLLNIGKFKLVGFSDGGNVAITYAIRHPERLSHLVVAGANISPSGLKMTTRLSIFTKYLLSKPSQNKNKRRLFEKSPSRTKQKLYKNQATVEEEF
jgi:pimeloyl-ACP methyl ester carboxylesterase